MKRLLRSLIDTDGGASQENLVQNYQKLVSSSLTWDRPEDEKIWEFLKSYFQQRLEMPAFSTLTDFFGDDTEIQERLKDVAAAERYIRTNFAHLLQGLLENQNKIKAVALLKEAHEIITRGLVMQEGREKVKKQGVREGLLHFTTKANELIIPEYNARVRGDIRKDGQAVWDDYQLAKADRGKVWGKFTGLNAIDKVCHGLKKGELHIHAGYAGHLKCLAGDATIFDHRTYKRRTLAEMFATGDLPEVTALHREGETFRLVRAEASHLVQNGERDVFDLTLASGRSVGATSNHKFFTPDGWRSLGDLKPGDHVAVPRRMATHSHRSPLTNAEVKVLGYLLGDGSFKEYISFTATNDEIRDDFTGCLVEMGLREGDADYETPSFKVQFSDARAPSVRVSHSTGAGNSSMVSPVRALLDGLDLWGLGAADKRIPHELIGLPEEQVALLLGALWSTDGSCHAKDHVRKDRDSLKRVNTISYASKSRALCLDVQSLLLRLGIRATVVRIETTYKGDPYSFFTTTVVGNDSKRKFTSKIRVVGKEEAFARLAERLPLNSGRTIPSAFLPADRKVLVMKGYQRHSNTVKLRSTVTAEEAQRFVTAEDGLLNEAIFGDLDWESVQSVTFRGKEMTYDLSVPEHHSFIVNDVVSHNTTFATNWCYNLVTRYRTNVFYASFEMKYEHIRRLIYVVHSANNRWSGEDDRLHRCHMCPHAPLDYRSVRDGELTPDEEIFYQLVIDDFNNNPEYCQFNVWSPDHDVDMDEMRLEAEMLHKELEIGFVVLDHGGLMEPRKTKRNKDYVVELNSILRDSKKFALHFNHGEGVPTLMLFQINRMGLDDADKNEGIYKMKALTYANEAEKSADVITTSYLDDNVGGNHRKNNQTKICNLKNRDNPLVEPFTATVHFKTRRITNLDTTQHTGNGLSVETHDTMLGLVGNV